MKVPKARKLPSGAWFIQLRLGGESIPVTARTEKECSRQAMLIKAEYKAGKRELPQDEVEEEKLPTLKKAIEKYINDRSNTLSPATLRGYETIKRNRFKGLMDRSLSDIPPEEWVTACNEEAALCSAKTLKNAWGFLASVYKEATGGRLPDVRLPQVIPNERPFLDYKQILAFIEAVHSTEFEVPFLLALHGLRRSEIMALRWENIELVGMEESSIHVKGAAVPGRDHRLVQKKENKNRSSNRYVPILIKKLYDALKAQQKEEGLVITCGPDKLERAVQGLCKANKLPLVGLHGLRHSFASLAKHLNIPEEYTMEICGWSDYHTMHKIYTHVAKRDMQRYQKAFGNFFSSKNANENANEEKK